MKSKKIHLYAIALSSVLMTTSCNDFLDREPITSITPEQYFKAESELSAYTIAYYTSVFSNYGGYNAGPINDDGDTDNMVVGEANTSLYSEGRWLVPTAKNLNFSMIRVCNYFFEQVLPKYEAGTISGDETNIKQYIGEMYVMRAITYFNLLKQFGDYPIITKVLQDNSEELMEASKRAPRNEVARFIISDLETALTYLNPTDKFNKVRINREMTNLLISRVALYEGTFEKYHKGTGRVPGDDTWPGKNMSYNSGKTFSIDSEIDYFLTKAMTAAATVADAHELTKNNGVMNPEKGVIDGWNPYYNMFSMPDPSTVDEVLMWRDYNSAESITNGWNAYIQEGGNNGMTKSYVNAFLMESGLPIYASSDYKGDATIDQQKANRDGRLQLFLFGESTLLYNNGDNYSTFEAPLVVGLTEHRDRTGFRIRKHFTYDQSQISNGVVGTNGLVLFRAVEAYLNYIEAEYVKNGTLDGKATTYWKTIRERAGIDTDFQKTIDATDLAQEPDWAKYSGSSLVDKTLYNIRRERRCEFIGEGFREDDLHRWRAYDALFEGNMGAYIPEGVNFWTSMYQSESYIDEKDGTSKLIEQAAGKSDANVSNHADSKYLRPYRIIKENNPVWDGYTWKKAHYLYPISTDDMKLTSPDNTIENSVIYQNPYWPTQASAGAIE
ncbi:RagB/SusD family nutrient uptake outer membrane protein [Bacteroides helcogenes]|uniref:RagB/SusD domain protein n=1 Tax=Bacteroides helcogenes (strain ATCC 35417 / DSM 20613 / JCM 6297 / CCUG 15421 / P 36-108) TaxID=693979 RepID=E6STR9_BACT6|nr:RagB/SusD family nutrient uptake outer membrane protein [Bacteroides helcogenes]ADV42272.1 RagB/SusD domain protein [Bacteroides helcogenes P 36-108]MDY5237274.1 RagB/SusD family nutrient uptake outer membrane protein [Bacteroides helcogenes]